MMKKNIKLGCMILIISLLVGILTPEASVRVRAGAAPQIKKSWILVAEGEKYSLKSNIKNLPSKAKISTSVDKKGIICISGKKTVTVKKPWRRCSVTIKLTWKENGRQKSKKLWIVVYTASKHGHKLLKKAAGSYSFSMTDELYGRIRGHFRIEPAKEEWDIDGGYSIRDSFAEDSDYPTYHFISAESDIEKVKGNKIYLKYPEMVYEDGYVNYTYYILKIYSKKIKVYFSRNSFGSCKHFYTAYKEK